MKPLPEADRSPRCQAMASGGAQQRAADVDGQEVLYRRAAEGGRGEGLLRGPGAGAEVGGRAEPLVDVAEAEALLNDPHPPLGVQLRGGLETGCWLTPPWEWVFLA